LIFELGNFEFLKTVKFLNQNYEYLKIKLRFKTLKQLKNQQKKFIQTFSLTR